jgi:hypothetical protein
MVISYAGETANTVFLVSGDPVRIHHPNRAARLGTRSASGSDAGEVKHFLRKAGSHNPAAVVG